MGPRRNRRYRARNRAGRRPRGRNAANRPAVLQSGGTRIQKPGKHGRFRRCLCIQRSPVPEDDNSGEPRIA